MLTSRRIALALPGLAALALTLAGCGGGAGAGAGGGGGGGAASPEILVFASNRNGNEEIFRMNPDGTGQVNLSNDPAEDDQPAISSDGTRVAFRSTRNGNEEIFIMNVDGTGATNLSNQPASDATPAFSPDGTRIAFFSSRSPAGIYTMNADGTSQTLRSGMVGGSNPSWSPDGTKLLFSANAVNGSGVLSREVFSVGADGQGLTNLTEDNGFDFQPAFSLDGTKITFTSTRGLISGSEVYVMDADGGNPTRLTNDGANVQSPRFSPDGSQIVFISDRDPAIGVPGNFFDVHIMNANGANRMALTNGESIDAFPQFTRDGTEIRYQRGNATLFPNSSLVVSRTDGTNVRSLTPVLGVDSELAFN